MTSWRPACPPLATARSRRVTFHPYKGTERRRTVATGGGEKPRSLGKRRRCHRRVRALLRGHAGACHLRVAASVSDCIRGQPELRAIHVSTSLRLATLRLATWSSVLALRRERAHALDRRARIGREDVPPGLRRCLGRPAQAVFQREPAEVFVGPGLAATRAAASVSRLIGNWSYDARRGPSGLGEEIGSACR